MRTTKIVWTSIVALALLCGLAISASAQDRDRDDQNRHVTQDRDHDRDNRDVWQNRNGWEYRTYTRNERPQGWQEGSKSEWRNCDDGTTKREYECYNYQYQGQPYYYYRDDDGRMIVRRQHHDSGNRDHDHDRDHDRNNDHHH